MLYLVLPSHLLELVYKDEYLVQAPQDAVSLDADCWLELVAEVRHRFPHLASRVFTKSGSLARGFVLVVNDEVVSEEQSALQLGEGSQVSIIPMLAGG